MEKTTILIEFEKAVKNIEEIAGDYYATVKFNEDDAQENEENTIYAFEHIEDYEFLFKEKGFTIEKAWRDGYEIDIYLKSLIDEWFDNLSYVDKCVAIYITGSDTFTPSELKKMFTPEEMLLETYGETELNPEWWYNAPLTYKQYVYKFMKQ